ncbi:hypothetical protein [Nonomuraea zeae]|uniref:Outer membrane channel protein CpnT-like N-terminal domain-containing protein n=1 Tax=Nonomuraea zeae TaxID=1642303 RepID=A0A5S4FBL6_9ACTN|nr:hypothetical protein [Nonomuraea zeae]TMR15042.1 hypothetical protein ETD85_56350 [Nonomuraea zeae]
MGFDGFLVPDWAKPWVGWAVGTDWPEGDEDGCFRLADACAAMARKVVEHSGAWDGHRPASDEWDGPALEAFAEWARTHVGGTRADLVDRLVKAALEFNQLGVQVEYTKRMIEVAVWLLILQLAWLLAAAAGPWGGLSFGLIGARVQIARLTIRQIAVRLLLNAAVFGGLMAGLDLAVQASQSRRDEIDLGQVLLSAATGALTGALLGGMGGALSRMASPGLHAGLLRAEMSLLDKVVAASSRSVWGMMAQSGVANMGATGMTLAATGDFSWRMVLQAGTSGALGGADAHAAGWTPSWRGSVDAGPATGRGPDGPPSPDSGGTAPHGTDLADVEARSAGSVTGPVRRAEPGLLSPEHLDPGSRLADSVSTGERSARTVAGREVVRFGDGTQAIRRSGLDGDRLQASALVRRAVGLDQPAVHRDGAVVYQRYGDERLQAALASGVRESRVENLFASNRELVTFNDGTTATRTAYGENTAIDRAEQRRLPPYTAARDGYLRTGPLEDYTTRLGEFAPSTTTHRSLLDLLTLNESFETHVAETHRRRPTIIDFPGADRMAEANVWSPFVERPAIGDHRVRLRRNDLSRADLRTLRTRLDDLRPAFERLGRPDWHDGVMDRLRLVERQARGREPILGDLDAPPPPGPEPTPLLRQADQRPAQALRELFDGNRLHRVNDAIVHDTPQAATARAHLDLAVSGLDDLPSGLRGHVETRVPADWLPGGLSAGDRFAFPGVMEGVTNPRVLADRPDSVHLVIRASDYVSTAAFLDRPGHASFRPDTAFKMLAVLENDGVKTYFLLQEPGAPTSRPPAAPLDPSPRVRRHQEEHRVPTEAGVWLRDPEHQADVELSSGALAMPRRENVLAVVAHGSPEGLHIGGDRLNAREIYQVIHEDLRARPDADVIYLVPCLVGRSDLGPAQGLANLSGRVVVAADTTMIMRSRTGETFPSSTLLDTLHGRGRHRIFLPDEPMTPDAPVSRIEQLLNHGGSDATALLSAEPPAVPPLRDVLEHGPRGREEEVRAWLRETTSFTHEPSGLRVHLDEVVFEDGRISLSYEIYRGDEVVGTAERQLDRSPAGRLQAFHDTFSLRDDLRDGGLGAGWTEHMESRYRELGVETVRLFAGYETGGYVWARMGYDFAERPGLGGFGEIVNPRDAVTWETSDYKKLVDAFDRAAAEGRLSAHGAADWAAVRARVTRRAWEEGYRLTPYEFSRIGVTDRVTEGRHVLWDGKRILRDFGLEQGWHGEKQLTTPERE